jgi:hypothetical protein
MADDYGTEQSQPEIARRRTPLADQQAVLFEELAERAEGLARTAELSAEVHAQMPAHLLTPPDHAGRDRMLAAAERAAAEAYRAHRLPPDEVRDAIRRAGDISTTGPGRESAERRRES